MTAQAFLEKFPETRAIMVNCLCDRACPECGVRGRLLVATELQGEVTDDGVDATKATNWSFTEESPAECSQCGYSATWLNFHIEGLDDELAKRHGDQPTSVASAES